MDGTAALCCYALCITTWMSRYEGVPNKLVSECTPEVIGWIGSLCVDLVFMGEPAELWKAFRAMIELDWMSAEINRGPLRKWLHHLSLVLHGRTSMHFGSFCSFNDVGHADSRLVLPRNPATPALSPQTLQIVLIFEPNPWNNTKRQYWEILIETIDHLWLCSIYLLCKVWIVCCLWGLMFMKPLWNERN